MEDKDYYILNVQYLTYTILSLKRYNIYEYTNNAKSIIYKKEVQINIYTLIQYFKCTYYIILLYACYNKRVFKCSITFSPYSFSTIKVWSLRLKESEDKQ